MKIVHICRQFFPSIGGVENVVENLTREQVKNGHTVSIVTLNRLFNTGEFIKNTNQDPQDVIIHRIPYYGSDRYPIAPSVLLHLQDANIIHIHNVDFFVDFLVATKFFHRKKIILHTHGGFFHTKRNVFAKKFFFNTISRLSLSKCHAVIACSENDYNTFRKIKKNNLYWIDNGIEIAKYHTIEKKITPGALLYVGRIDHHKKVSNLVKLAAHLKQISVPCKLNVVGPDWGATDNVQQLAKKLNVENEITIHGSVSSKALNDLYKKAHIFVSASEYEGFGITALEAMATGTVCALQNIPTFSKFIAESKCGIVTDFNDTPKAASEISILLSTKLSELADLDTKQKQYTLKFAWNKVNAKIEEIYNS